MRSPAFRNPSPRAAPARVPRDRHPGWNIHTSSRCRASIRTSKEIDRAVRPNYPRTGWSATLPAASGSPEVWGGGKDPEAVDYVAALRHFDARRQVFGYRIRQRHFTSLDHIGQQQRREYLRLNHRISGRWSADVDRLIETAGKHDRVLSPSDNTTTIPTLWCSLSILLTSAIVLRISVRRNGRFRRRLRRQQNNCKYGDEQSL